MSRYKNTKLSRINNKNHYKTTYYSNVPEKNDDMYFIAQEGDRCDNLAFRFYGTPDLWWFVARVNNLKTMNIPAGTNLRIPTTTDNAKGF
mgnify:FL=1